MLNFSRTRIAFIFGIIALSAVMAFSFTACDDGGGDSGGGVPSELVGKWHEKLTDVLVIEFTSSKCIISGQTMDVSINGNTVEPSISGTSGGKFDYSINNAGEMVISNGTVGYIGWNGWTLVKK